MCFPLGEKQTNKQKLVGWYKNNSIKGKIKRRKKEKKSYMEQQREKK